MRRILIALFVAGALVASTAASAAAQQTTLRDARHDTWRSAAVGQMHPAPTARLADVTRAVVSHGHRRIVVTLSFVELSRSTAYANYTVLLESRSRRTREITLEASRRNPEGTIRVFMSSGRTIPCEVSHRIDYPRNRVQISVARACMQRAGTIRANIRVHRSNAQGVFYADNPHDRQATSAAWTRWLRAARR